MSFRGFIKIHREIIDHWIWQDKPFSKGQAFIDMLMKANSKQNKVPIGSTLFDVSRGQFITSELNLMAHWGWSKTKVRNFLNMLEKDQMIIKKSDSKKTTVTICNYNSFQSFINHRKTTERQQKDFKKTTKRHKQE